MTKHILLTTGKSKVKVKVKTKSSIAVNVYIHLTATECHLPYGITQCYLPPDTSEHTPPSPQPDRLVLDLPTI